MPSNYYWHESSTGQIHGPEAADAIVESVRAGQIHLSDFVAIEGTQAWMPLAQSQFACHSKVLSDLLADLEFGPNEEKQNVLGQIRTFRVPLESVNEIFFKLRAGELEGSKIRFLLASTRAALGDRSQETIDDVIANLSAKCFAGDSGLYYFPWLREVAVLSSPLTLFAPATRVATIEALSFFKENKQVGNVLARILSDEDSKMWRDFILYAVAAQALPGNIGYLHYYKGRGSKAAAIGLEHFSKATMIEMLRIEKGA